MKRMILCAVAALVPLTSAAVADGPAAARPWTGFYIGAGAGAGSVVQIQSLNVPGFGTVFSESSGGEGLFATVTAGYDYRVMQRFVAGAFFDYDFSRISTNNSGPILFSLPFDHNHSWSLGGRLGYLASPTTLWYLLGGYTRASFDFDTVGAIDFGGYFVGGGVETLLGDNWSVRGEYRFTQFLSETLETCGCGTIDAEPSMHTGRLVLVYKLGTP